MELNIFETADLMGKEAARASADIIANCIKKKNKARIVLSTGASQFDFLKHFVSMKVDWGKVEVFHLDEYVGLSKEHPASFRKYITDRFLSKVKVAKIFFVDGDHDAEDVIANLTHEIEKEDVDLALIGIGENAHIAFNDPPADFETRTSYRVVNLDDQCKRQQVGEGWFSSLDEVPKQAITMTPYQIMQSKTIISCVPYTVKAEAIRNTLENELTPMIPATILKTHPDWRLYLDKNSASRIHR